VKVDNRAERGKPGATPAQLETTRLYRQLESFFRFLFLEKDQEINQVKNKNQASNSQNQ
jgi:hypothetical protein